MSIGNLREDDEKMTSEGNQYEDESAEKAL
jgi:hypothetical protein